GAPVDIGAGGAGGSRHGPSEVRARFPVLGLNVPNEAARQRGRTRSEVTSGPLMDVEFRRLYDEGRRPVSDLGHVVYVPGDSQELFGARLRRTIREVVRLGLIPVTIGGDHSITWPILDALLDHVPKLGIIHFDAHHDLYPGPENWRQLNHATPFTFVLE